MDGSCSRISATRQHGNIAIRCCALAPAMLLSFGSRRLGFFVAVGRVGRAQRSPMLALCAIAHEGPTVSRTRICRTLVRCLECPSKHSTEAFPHHTRQNIRRKLLKHKIDVWWHKGGCRKQKHGSRKLCRCCAVGAASSCFGTTLYVRWEVAAAVLGPQSTLSTTCPFSKPKPL